MITLLIADDERTARDHMIACVDWNALGIEIVGIAGDGVTAWELMNAHRPDLALIDIRMPGMDGLELARRASEEGLLTRILIVSGYDNFSYAQKALEYHAFRYILKPYSPDELIDALRASISDLPSRERERSPLNLFTGSAPGEIGYPHELEQETLKAIAHCETPEAMLERFDAFFDALAAANETDRALSYGAMIFLAELSRSMLRYGYSLPAGNAALGPGASEDLRGSLRETLRQACLAAYHMIRGSGHSSQLIRTVIRFIEAHYAEKLSLTAVAEEVHVSPVYLSGLFTREVGQTLTQYLQQYRIDRAKQMLLHTQDSIETIAESVGYGDARYFVQIFRRITGVTPVVYRSRSHTEA